MTNKLLGSFFNDSHSIFSKRKCLTDAKICQA
jgi:hypothetical protein